MIGPVRTLGLIRAYVRLFCGNNVGEIRLSFTATRYRSSMFNDSVVNGGGRERERKVEKSVCIIR